MMIPVFSNTLGKEELAAVERVFASRWLGRGKECAAFEQEFGSRLEIVHTHGSLENLQRVADGELQLAFYQEGVGTADNVRSVINLEYELVFVLVNKKAGIHSLTRCPDSVYQSVCVRASMPHKN